jgi:hypothetical protein
MAVVEDSTGAKFSIFPPGEHSGGTDLGPKPRTFGWSELATTDTEAVKNIYTEMSNWGTKLDEEMGTTEWYAGGTRCRESRISPGRDCPV